MEYIIIFTAIALVLSGTIAGYITNKYAVRWLFKPVTLFGRQLFDFSILGTLEKQKAFIESISECVESRILTQNVLKKELCDAAIKSHIGNIIDEFLAHSLPESLRNLRVKDLEDYEKSRDMLRSYIEEALNRQLSPLLKELCGSIQISDYFTDDQIEHITACIYDVFRSQLKHNQALKNDLTGVLSELFFTAMRTDQGRAALSKLASKAFSLDKMLESLANFELPKGMGRIIRKAISSSLHHYAEKKTLEEALSEENKRILIVYIRDAVLHQFDTLAEACAEEKTEVYIDLLSRNEKLKRALTEIIYDSLEQNFMNIVDGRIKETVKLALHQLDPDQLCAAAEKLLAGELKYLSYFGACMGFVISLPALYLTLPNTLAIGFAHNPLGLLFSVFLMAFIGIITNIIAIKMFFHPFRENKMLASFQLTRSLARGVILQNQSRFARTLGEYIGKELLTPENILKMLDNNEALFKIAIIEKLFPFLNDFLLQENNAEKLADLITTKLFQFSYENRIQISEAFAARLCEKTLHSLIDLRSDKTRKRLRDMALDFLYKKRESVVPTGEEETDYRFIFQTALDIVKESTVLQAKIGRTFLHFYQGGPTSHIHMDSLGRYTLGGLNIGNMLIEKDLAAALEKYIGLFCNREQTFKALRKQITEEILHAAENSNAMLTLNCKKNIIERIAGAAYLSTRRNATAILEDLHIAQTTTERVESLTPAEIKDLVLSFAAPAFRKLYWLGAIGGIFGLNCYLSYLLFLLDATVEKLKNK